MRSAGWAANPSAAARLTEDIIGSGALPPCSSRAFAAELWKRTSPSSSITITASPSPSKIAVSLSRSAVSTPKLSFRASRIESSERARSPISSRPRTGSRTSKLPEARSSALAAIRLSRPVITEAIPTPTRVPIRIAISAARRLSERSVSIADRITIGREYRPTTAPSIAPSSVTGIPTIAISPPLRSREGRSPSRAWSSRSW